MTGHARADDGLLGAADIRLLADRLGVRPTKQKGQNFVIDGNTVRRIVRTAEVGPDDVVIEVGPGLGSLTLALLPEVARVVAVEIDDVLAPALATTVRGAAPGPARPARGRARRRAAGALARRPGRRPRSSRTCPYNVSVPVMLHLLEHFPTHPSRARDGAARGGRPARRRPGLQGVRRAQREGALVRRRRARGQGRAARCSGRRPTSTAASSRITAHAPPETTATRAEVFAVVDAAFAQRRKTLRAALAGWAGLARRGRGRSCAPPAIDPSERGEQPRRRRLRPHRRRQALTTAPLGSTRQSTASVTLLATGRVEPRAGT